jgi:hypothetical protein
VSFLILTSVFVDDQEWEAVVCYTSGLAGSLLLLLQAAAAGLAPPGAALAAAALACASLAANAARAAGWLHGGAGAGLWSCWRGALGCLGWAAVPQILYLTLVLPACGAAAAPPAAPWGPAAVSLGLGAGLALVLLRLGDGGRGGTGSTGAGILGSWSVPAWTATLLFMLEPLAALVNRRTASFFFVLIHSTSRSRFTWQNDVRCSMEAKTHKPNVVPLSRCAQAAAARAGAPSALAAAAPADFLLPALATGLQVPRALLRDHMWCTGEWVECQGGQGWWSISLLRALGHPHRWGLAGSGGWSGGGEGGGRITRGASRLRGDTLWRAAGPVAPDQPLVCCILAAGTSYATLFACLQAALAAAARGHGGAAAALAAAPLLAAACLLAGTAAVQGQGGPLAPLCQLADGYRREQRPWRRLGMRLAARLRRPRWLIDLHPASNH